MVPVADLENRGDFLGAMWREKKQFPGETDSSYIIAEDVDKFLHQNTFAIPAASIGWGL